VIKEYIKEFVKDNKTATITIVIVLAVVMLLATLSGCKADDLIQIKTPPAVQKAIGVESQISLADAGYAWNEWSNHIKLNSERFAAEIEEGRSTLILINSLTDMGLSALSGPMQTVPGGAVIVGGVSMLAGIFVRKPGTKKQLEAAWEQGFGEGQAFLNVEEEGDDVGAEG
tara:strand:- start:21577 stop:22089 length:513 start_codon:yes stop_codon:yes gene_type:complete